MSKMSSIETAGRKTVTPKASGLLQQVALRVLPTATLVLLVIWLTVGHVSDRVFEAEMDAKLQQQAESQAIVAKTRLENLVTTVRDLAGNDLIVNGLIDADSMNHYLKPFLRSAAIEGFSALSIVITDYRGRPIVGRGPDVWDRSQLTRWNEKASLEQLVLTVDAGGLVVGVPIYIGHLVEGMFVVRFLPEQLDQLLSPIGADGRVELVAISPEPIGEEQTPSENDSLSLQAELALSGSDELMIRSTIPKTAGNSKASHFQWFMLVAFVLDL
ncbi:MAG: hypothetical protein AAGA73_15490, partial [Pseudomonadota bacterium]